MDWLTFNPDRRPPPAASSAEETLERVAVAEIPGSITRISRQAADLPASLRRGAEFCERSRQPAELQAAVEAQDQLRPRTLDEIKIAAIGGATQEALYDRDEICRWLDEAHAAGRRDAITALPEFAVLDEKGHLVSARGVIGLLRCQRDVQADTKEMWKRMCLDALPWAAAGAWQAFCAMFPAHKAAPRHGIGRTWERGPEFGKAG